MSTIINASSAGLTHSADASSTLALQTNATNALTIAPNQFINHPTIPYITPANTTPFSVGPNSVLSYSDLNILGWFNFAVNSYSQVIHQNSLTGSNASVDIVLNNDSANSIVNYVDLGMNSTNFSGTGPFSDPNGGYLYSSGTNLTLGTTGAFDTKIVTNGNVVMNTFGANGNVIISNHLTCTSIDLNGTYVPTTSLASNIANNQVFLRGDQQWVPINVPNYPTQLSQLGVGTTPPGTVGQIIATNSITSYYSDERLKDIISVIPQALNKVMNLRGVIFTQNKKAEEFGYNNYEQQVGVIAQDVEKVLPEVIKPAPFDMDENGGSKSGENYMTVQYDRLVPLLIEAIKEQQVQIEELKSLISK
jgi:Chaperone of endosialidase